MTPDALPALRGLLHQYTLLVSVPAAVLLAALAPPGTPRATAVIYGIGLNALFACSALYHRWPGDSPWKPRLRRLDHSTIFLFIAASYTPIAAVVLEGSLRTVVLVSAWACALGGVVLSVGWIDAPRALQAVCYVGVGWIAVIAIPQLLDDAGVAPVALIAVGGALYTAGAVIYALQRPDPWPRVYGFHEVFHTLVIAAAAVHFVAIAGWILPHGA